MKKKGEILIEGWKPSPLEQSLIDGTFDQLRKEYIDSEEIPDDLLEIQDFETAMEEIKAEIDMLDEDVIEFESDIY